jgi:hypothetical protein
VARQAGRQTLLLIDTEHNNDLVAADANELLDTANTTPRELRKKNHAVDIIILEELDVGTHVGDLANMVCQHAGWRQCSDQDSYHSYLFHIDHNKGVDLRVLLLVKTAV